MRRQKTGSWGEISGDEESGAPHPWDAADGAEGWGPGSRDTSPTALALRGRRKSHNYAIGSGPGPSPERSSAGGKTPGTTSGNDEKTTTVNEAALNLANCVMGAGALSLPSYFKSCGVVLGILVLLLSGAWTWVSCEMMLRTADAVSQRFLRGKPVGTYEDLVDLTLGWRGRVATTAGIVLLQIGCLVGYANILTDVVSPFAIDILPPGLEPNRGAILAAVTLGGMLPMGVVVGGDAGGVLALVSKLSMSIVAVFAVALTCHAFAPGTIVASPGTTALPGGEGADSLGVGVVDPSPVSPIVWFNPGGVMSALPLALFAFGAHPAVLPVVKTMRPQTLDANTKLVTTVLAACAVGYLMIGLGGYLSFRKATAGNVLRNVDGFFLGQTGAKAIKFGYALVILASVPTILLPLQKGAKDAYVALVPSAAIHISGGGPTPGKPPRPTNEKAKNPNEKANTANTAAASGVVVDVAPEVAARLAQGVALGSMLVALTLSLYVPNVAFAFGLTGSTCSFLVAFILPSLAYLSVTGTGPRGGARRRGRVNTTGVELGKADKADADVELREIEETVTEGGRSFVSAAGLSKPGAGRSGVANGNGWEWLQESESDLSDDPAASLVDKEKQNGHSRVVTTGKEPVFAGDRSERIATRRRRGFAKATIVLAVILMYFCTREVVREVWHERKIVEVVSKITDAKLEAAKLEKDVETIESAKEEYAESQKQFKGALTNATVALSDVERTGVGADELEKMNQTIAEKTKQFAKAPPAGGGVISDPPPAPNPKPKPSEEKKTPEPKPKPSTDGQPPPAGDETSVTDPSAGDEVIQKAEESLKKVEEVEAKSEEAKGKLEDALGLVDEKQRRKEEKERREESAWLEGWVKEHQGEDSSILANVDAGAKDAGKKDTDAKKKEEKKDKKDIKDKKRDEGGIDGAGDESSSSSSEDFVHENDVANDYADDKRKASGAGDGGPGKEPRKKNNATAAATAVTDEEEENGGIPDPSDVVARADEKVKELSEQKQEVEKKTDEVLREAAAREGIDEDEANALAEALAATKMGASGVTEKKAPPPTVGSKGADPGADPGAAVPSTSTRAAGDGDAEEAKGEASEDLFTGRRRLF